MIEAYFKNKMPINALNIFGLLKNMGFEDFENEHKALIGEIYLSMGYYREAYVKYFVVIDDLKLRFPKIKLLLEDILLKVDFSLEDKSEYMIQIGLILEKIENNKVLKVADYSKITEFCDL